MAIIREGRVRVKPGTRGSGEGQGKIDRLPRVGSDPRKAFVFDL